MGVRCQIIMWLRLCGALPVGSACWCGRTEMMSAAYMHILKPHRQTGGREIGFFFISCFLCTFLFHPSLHRPSAVLPSFSLRSLCITQQPVFFFFLGKHTCRAAHVKPADDVMAQRLIDRDRLQPWSPFINITSHWRSDETNGKAKRKLQTHINLHIHAHRPCTSSLDSFQPILTLCSSKRRPLIWSKLNSLLIIKHFFLFAVSQNLLFPHFDLFQLSAACPIVVLWPLCCGLVSS